MKTYTPTDQNTKDLLKNWTRKNGQNYELFIRYGSDKTITAKTLKQIEQDPTTTFKSNRRINFQCYPFLFKHDYKETVFVDWESSTFYQHFKLNNDGLIEVTELPRNTISYADYERYAIKKIESNIKNFIDANNDIVLMYSQGIDSILLMAYLKKYNALSKTELVYVNNSEPVKKPITHDNNVVNPYWAHRFTFEDDILTSRNLDLSFEKTLGFKKITEIKMDENTLKKWASSIDPEPFNNYQSYEVAEQFKDRPMLVGFEGNSVLLHKWEWIRRIGKRIPIDKKYYTNTINNIDWSLDWNNDWNIITYITPETRGWNCEAIKNEYSPISDFELMSMLPFIDTETIDPLNVANATLAKKMIVRLVGDTFNHLIVNEGNDWINFWNLARIPVQEVEPENLFLYVNKKSNLHNVSFCKKALQMSKKTGWIFAVDLLHIKFTNKITLMYKDKFPTSIVSVF